MDADKDGIIGKNDLRQTFDSVGRLATDKELDEMLAEAPGPINFTQLLNLFASRMSGSGMGFVQSKIWMKVFYRLWISGADDDDVVIQAFNTFDNNGKIDGEK